MNDEIEIDLKKYILTLLKHWWQILVFTAILAIVVFALTSLTKPAYQATALVAITKPRFQLNFNSQIQSLDIQPANSAFIDLATSDDVLMKVFNQWTNRPASIKDLTDFRKSMVKVVAGSDTSILKLVITADNASDAANLANLWASALIDQSKSVYFGQKTQLSFLEEQMQTAKTDLDTAEKALVDFQAQNQLFILTNELTSTLQNQKDYLAIQLNINYVNESLKGLRSQIVSNPGNQTSITNQLSVLILQLQTYNNRTIEQISTIPVQIQLTDPAVFGSLDNQTQISIVDNLVTSLQDRSTQVDTNLQNLTPKILQLQQSVQQYQSDLDQLQRTVNIATKTYTSLAQSVDQTRIASQDPTNELQLASSALPPTTPLSRNRVRNTLIGGFAAGLLAVIAVLVLDWWHNAPSSKEK